MNRALSSLQEGSLNITLTVPLKLRQGHISFVNFLTSSNSHIKSKICIRLVLITRDFVNLLIHTIQDIAPLAIVVPTLKNLFIFIFDEVKFWSFEFSRKITISFYNILRSKTILGEISNLQFTV